MAVVALAVAFAFLFGAVDQYLGSFSSLAWATEISLLSAPWLVVPFLAGCTRPRRRDAMLVGLACTLAAIAGYGLMTLSPVQNAELTWQSASGFLRSQAPVIVGGCATGPLFGFLGSAWRFGGWTVAAVAPAAALCLEPLAHLALDDPVTVRWVAVVEAAVGGALVVAVVAHGYLRSRRIRSREPSLSSVTRPSRSVR